MRTLKLRASKQTVLFIIEDEQKSFDSEKELHELTVDSAKALAEFVDHFTSETFERELFDALKGYVGVSVVPKGTSTEAKQE